MRRRRHLCHACQRHQGRCCADRREHRFLAGAYGQHTAIMDQYDVIVLAPQVRSYYNDMKADTDRLGIKLLAPRGKEYIDLTRDPAGAIKWLRENLD